MLKPQMPTMPGVGAMNDTLDFVKNLWGSMAVPGMGMPAIAAPAMSIEDLDKKIADLKAVEGWLNLNLSMLRGTIHTLEVQRGTIATLKSMGEAMSNAVKQPGANQSSVLAAAPYASAFFGQPMAPSAASAPPAAAPAQPEAKPEPAAEQPKDAAAAAAAAAMTNPAAWWNMLQSQFTQAVTTAMSPDAVASAAAKAQDTAAAMREAAVAPAREIQKAMSKPRDGEPKNGADAESDAKRGAARRAAKPKDEPK
jgi:hypothetical protein